MTENLFNASAIGATFCGRGKPVEVRLSDGSVVQNPRTGGPLLMPEGVSLEKNVAIGELMRNAWWVASQEVTREQQMLALFFPRSIMDYQRLCSVDGRINKTFIDFGNYNYGAVAAAAGYTYSQAIVAAGMVNLWGSGDKSGPWFNNPRNLYFIEAGYSAYMEGKIRPTAQ